MASLPHAKARQPRPLRQSKLGQHVVTARYDDDDDGGVDDRDSAVEGSSSRPGEGKLDTPYEFITAEQKGEGDEDIEVYKPPPPPPDPEDEQERKAEEQHKQ